jgi:hypothetical protein
MSAFATGGARERVTIVWIRGRRGGLHVEKYRMRFRHYKAALNAHSQPDEDARKSNLRQDGFRTQIAVMQEWNTR